MTQPATGKAARLRLNVVSTPSNNLVPTNFAYVSPSQFIGRPTYVRIGNCVFIAQPHDKIQEGTIALNKVQRNSARASMSRPVDVEVFQIPTHDFMLERITFELDFVAPGAAFMREIDGKALLDQIKAMYSNHVFSEDQRFIVEIDGIMLMALVTSLSVLETRDLVADAKDDSDTLGKIRPLHTMGMLVQSTDVHITKPKSSSITFTNLESVSSSVATRNIFKTDFTFEKLGIGGLDAELGRIFRRAFASRIFPPDVIKKLGVKHVKGILLYGPPGTGKTLMARQIGKMLNTHEPVVVNGPEILNKYVGQSEENIRSLFEAAEQEYEEKGDASDLHLIIFDEIDAICKQRGTVSSGTGVNDSVVNQLLSKIDGVKALNNVLIIGMTNRLDLLDEALLRPGRFEVQMEIGLPDEKGRLQILRIHTENMRKSKYMSDDVDLAKIATLTKNYSGAELEGVVKSATSFALNRQVDVDNLDKKKSIADAAKNIRVTMEDFELALEEVRPAFGVSQSELEAYLSQGIIDYGPAFSKLVRTCNSFVSQIRNSKTTNLLTLLLSGSTGVGKTTLAAFIAKESDLPFVKVISPETMVGYSESAKCGQIAKVFNDAYKSPMSVIVLDNIERLIEYVHIGPRFSNVLLQTILVLLKRQPPQGRKLLIIGTTNLPNVLRSMEVLEAFNVELRVPALSSRSDIRTVLLETGAFNKDTDALENAVKVTPERIGIRQLLMVIEMARSRIQDAATEGETGADGPGGDALETAITYDEYLQSLQDCGLMNLDLDDDNDADYM